MTLLERVYDSVPREVAANRTVGSAAFAMHEASIAQAAGGRKARNDQRTRVPRDSRPIER